MNLESGAIYIRDLTPPVEFGHPSLPQGTIDEIRRLRKDGKSVRAVAAGAPTLASNRR